jgi:hypothetical protein
MSVESIRVTVVRSRARRVASSLSREASGSWQHSYNIAIWLTKSLSSCNEKLSQQWYDYLSTANLASPFQDSVNGINNEQQMLPVPQLTTNVPKLKGRQRHTRQARDLPMRLAVPNDGTGTDYRDISQLPTQTSEALTTAITTICISSDDHRKRHARYPEAA